MEEEEKTPNAAELVPWRKSAKFLEGCQMSSADRHIVCSALINRVATAPPMSSETVIDIMHHWALTQYGRSFTPNQLESCVVMTLLNMLTQPMFRPGHAHIMTALYRYNFGPTEGEQSKIVSDS